MLQQPEETNTRTKVTVNKHQTKTETAGMLQIKLCKKNRYISTFLLVQDNDDHYIYLCVCICAFVCITYSCIHICKLKNTSICVCVHCVYVTPQNIKLDPNLFYTGSLDTVFKLL